MEERSQPASGVADKWPFNFAPAVRRPRDERSHGSEEASLSLARGLSPTPPRPTAAKSHRGWSIFLKRYRV